jgi:hypothetical protein
LDLDQKRVKATPNFRRRGGSLGVDRCAGMGAWQGGVRAVMAPARQRSDIDNRGIVACEQTLQLCVDSPR